MAAPGPTIGHANKTYYNTGSYDTPTWVLIDEISDETHPDLNVDVAQLNVRSSDWKLNLPARLGAAFEFTLLWNPGNTAFDALRTAWLARTIRQYAFVNGEITTSDVEGLKAYCFISQFNATKNQDEVSVAGVR